MTKENIKWPDVFDVPDYSLLVANELVPAIGLPPPDGKWLLFNTLDSDEIFNDFNERLKIHEDEFGVWHYILENDERKGDKQMQITDEELKQFLEQEYKDEKEYAELLTTIKSIHDSNEKYKDISLQIVFPAAHYLYFTKGIKAEPIKLLDLSVPYTEEYLNERANDYFNKRIDADGNACCELWNNYLNFEHE